MVETTEKPKLTEQERNLIIIKRKFWYNRVFNIFSIIENLKHRELAFLPAKEEEKGKGLKMRNLFCEKYDIWQIIAEKVGFLDKLVNVYNSVATFEFGAIPMASLNIYRRLEDEEYKLFNETYASKIKFYDFLIDIDGENFTDAYCQAKIVKELFDEYKLPYYIANSSSKGFHITIDGKYLIDYPVLDLPNILNLVAFNIKGIYGLKGLDTSIFDFRRIRKSAYSINCGDTTVVLPLSDEEFNEKLKVHQEKYFQSSRVLNVIKLLKRGLLTRTHGLSEEQLKENCKKFIETFK